MTGFRADQWKNMAVNAVENFRAVEDAGVMKRLVTRVNDVGGIEVLDVEGACGGESEPFVSFQRCWTTSPVMVGASLVPPMVISTVV